MLFFFLIKVITVVKLSVFWFGMFESFVYLIKHCVSGVGCVTSLTCFVFFKRIAKVNHANLASLEVCFGLFRIDIMLASDFAS